MLGLSVGRLMVVFSLKSLSFSLKFFSRVFSVNKVFLSVSFIKNFIQYKFSLSIDEDIYAISPVAWPG